MVAFLCGVLARKKTPPVDPDDDAAKREDNPDISAAAQAPADQPSASSTDESPDATASDQQQPLPPPPGTTGHHMRAASCHHHHHQQRSSSSASKLVSSMSMRVLGSRREAGEKPRKEKKLKQEDSIWKKTIILGEKCRVPDDDEDSILYDEKGNRIATFHPKSQNVGAMSFSRQTSCIEFNKQDRK